jgi:hypothetical protein
MKKSDLTVEVLVRGRPVKEFYHHDGNVYIEGRKNSNFELRIRNNTFNRVLVIPSVDGLSVMDGEKADTKSNGYVVNALTAITIPGWRLDSSEVAKFFFQGNKGEGYAAQMEESGNEGVLGFLFFEEEVVISWTMNNIYPVVDPYHRPWGQWTIPIGSGGGTCGGTTRTVANDPVYDSNSVTEDFYFSAEVGKGSQMSFTSGESSGEIKTCGGIANVANADPAIMNISEVVEEEEHVSVGFGESKGFETQSVDFKRGKQLSTFVIYYDTRKGLEKRGIEVVAPTPKPVPNPFPGDKGCTPPQNWKS